MKLVKDEPQKYIVCNLSSKSGKVPGRISEIEDTKTPGIPIRGRVRRAFDKDKVVVEMSEKKARPKVLLEHIIGPHERQFVCTTDYDNPALMVPINKSATKLVNLTDKSCKDIPIYKKDHNERATKVKMMKREKVLSGKYMFVVKYLQWRRGLQLPSRNCRENTVQRKTISKVAWRLLMLDYAIRRVFKEETVKYGQEEVSPRMVHS
ncbi:helicase [Desmophyllum pertusum]|uniref:Helicase n=1 Tax=Desmophyllum pertusum TaxID=174260 RepID=A0A9W9ZB63_9CNID|nr:helicase [Desmophyllum pertusum]